MPHPDLTIFSPSMESPLPLPLMVYRVSAGFPSPAADDLQSRLDLNQRFVQNPPATFYVYAEGDSMEGAGIRSGDLLLVDRAAPRPNGCIIFARLADCFTVKRLRITGRRLFLVPESSRYPITELVEDDDCEIWGRVMSIHREL